MKRAAVILGIAAALAVPSVASAKTPPSPTACLGTIVSLGKAGDSRYGLELFTRTGCVKRGIAFG